MARSQRIQTQLSAARVDGYLTVFLSLSLTIMLSLVLTLIEGARIYAIRMQAECVVRTAMDSCLAEYNKALEHRYNIFLVDTTYGSGGISEDALTEHLQDYMNRNLERTSLATLTGTKDLTALTVSSCEVTDSRYACDDNGAAIREQIEAYMTAGPEAALASNLPELFADYEDLDPDAWQEAFDECSDEFEEALEAAMEDVEENDDREDGDDIREDDEHDEEGEEQLNLVTEILEEIRAFIGSAFLIQVLGGDDAVSDSSIEGEDLLEDRDLHYGSSYQPENAHHYPEAGSVVMGQYILEQCGNYREQVDGCALQYEAEYIVFGERTDRRNMECMSERLVLLRAAADLAAIHGIHSCVEAAEAVGAVLQLFLGIPESVTRELILVIWSYAEALQDVRTLYRGGAVPIIKTESSWQTSLHSLQSLESGSGSSGGKGLDYAMYLRLFLLAADLQDPDAVTERLMNIMELDISKEQNGIPLYLDRCLDAMKVDAAITSGYGYTARVQQDITYN